MNLAIRNGTIVTAAGAFKADVGIEGARVAALGGVLHGASEIDASGCYVLPGAIDPHVHLQMVSGNYVSSDDFATGTVAAACGGTTTIIDFVEPHEEDSLIEALVARRALADPVVAVDYGLHMTIPAWHADLPQELVKVSDIVAAGCSSFKMYLAYEGLRLDDAQLYRAMTAVARAGGLPIVHCENGIVCDVLRSDAVATGRVSPLNHGLTRPPRQEAEATGRAIDIASLAGSPIYIAHVSCSESLHRVRTARRRGEAVFAETCPQYLMLTMKQLDEREGERLICSPPLRTESDNRALWQALVDRTLDVLSTDHCPFLADEKGGHVDFTTIPGGLPSIESRLSLAYHFGHRIGLSLSRWVEVCSTRPAQLFGFSTKGHIAPGFDADIVIFDPQRAVTIAAGKTLHERVDWSPYEGMQVRGWPRDVLSRGRVIVRDGEFAGTPGWGRFVKRRVWRDGGKV